MPQRINPQVKNARKGENINDPIDTYIVDYVAMFFSRIFIKLRIVPNAVTVMSGIVGVTGGVLLCFNSLGTDIAAVIAVVLSAILDASDGQVSRLTGHFSRIGRTLDGFMDSVVYITIYAALCVRLFRAQIPFTGVTWGITIIPVSVVALFLFGAQARTADYFKNLHIFMSTRGGGELTRSAVIDRQISECKKPSFEHARLALYRAYTGLQEKKTPATQVLLDRIGVSCENAADVIFEEFLSKSRKYVMMTNLLTFNLRTIVLFILLFLPGDPEFLIFLFVIFILEPVRLVIIAKYEKLAASLTERNALAATER